MTKDQPSADYEFQEWIAEQVSDEVVEIELSGKASEQMLEAGWQLDDLIFALRNIKKIALNYEGGCYTVWGQNVDVEVVVMVVAPRSERNRIRIIKVWRE